VQLIVSENTLRKVEDLSAIKTRFLGPAVIRGSEERINIHEVFNADPEHRRLLKEKTASRFNEAVRAFHNHEKEKARGLFLECRSLFPEDELTRRYLEKMDEGDL